MKVTVRLPSQCSHPTTATNHIQQNQRSTPHVVTHGLCSPEDGHNDARNMLRQRLIINILLLHLVGFSSFFTPTRYSFVMTYILFQAETQNVSGMFPDSVSRNIIKKLYCVQLVKVTRSVV